MHRRNKTPIELNEPFEAIILRTFPFGESDIILRVLSPIGGKRSILAKGIRKEKNSFQQNFDVFDSGEFTTRKSSSSSLEVLAHFKPYKALFKLRGDLEVYIISSCIAESFDYLTRDNLDHETFQEEAKNLYETFGLTLRAIDEAKDIKEMLKSLYFGVHALMQICGYAVVDDGKPPSKNNLLFLLTKLEGFAEKELLSKSSIKELLDALSNTN